MVHTHKHWVSIFMGLILGIVSIPPVLNQLGITSINLPTFITTFSIRVMYILLFIGALYLLIDSSHETGTLQALSIIIGLIVGLFSLVQILAMFGVINIAVTAISFTILYFVLAIISILLFIGGFVYH